MIIFNISSYKLKKKRMIKRKIKTVEKAESILLIIMHDRFQMLAT